MVQNAHQVNARGRWANNKLVKQGEFSNHDRPKKLKKWTRLGMDRVLFWDLSLDLRSWIIWSWTIINLEEYSKSNMLQDQFEIHTAPGAYSTYAPGAVCIQIMLLEHIWGKTSKPTAGWPAVLSGSRWLSLFRTIETSRNRTELPVNLLFWSTPLEYSSRLLMVQDMWSRSRPYGPGAYSPGEAGPGP